MKRGLTGEWHAGPSVADEPVRAFVPLPLPPDPALVVDAPLRDELDRALVSIGRLDGIARTVPATRLFLYSYIRKEAVLSSQIEGTQSTLADLLRFEVESAPGAPVGDVAEVSSYARALEHGVKRMKEGLPLSNRLLRETHAILLERGRGSDKSPGEFRRSQNWIGGPRPGRALFVPPPPHAVDECMGRLERFLHDQPERTSPLLKAALAHAQFETIHPFLDGNGRVGRLLVTLILAAEGVLREPLLYLSLYLKTHRTNYYDLLQRVRTDGDWEEWVAFFARGVHETADQAVDAAERIVKLFADDSERIARLGHGAGSALRVHALLQRHPIVSIGFASTQTRLSVPATTNALTMGLGPVLGVVRELTGRQRGRLFGYQRYLDILNEDIEVP